MTSPILIYGTGGHGRELAWLAETCGFKVVSFVEDAPSRDSLNGVPVQTLKDARELAPDIIIGVGSPAVRTKLAAKSIASGLRIPNLVSPNAVVSPWVAIATTGVVICAGSVVSVDVSIGAHTHINRGAYLSHDNHVAEFVTVSPGCHIAGHVDIEARAYLGIGSTISNGKPGAHIRIGQDAMIGAGAVVISHVEAATTVVGTPAMPIVRHT